MNKPEISVIMPMHNSERYLKGAINSILQQTFRNFEFIIIDDGSSDNSGKIVKCFDDPRIKFFEGERQGIVQQLNFGLTVANSDVIARMDSDDTCNPQRLTIQYNYLKNNKSVDLVGTNFNIINERGNFVVRKNLPECHNDIEFMMPVTASVLHSTILTYKKTVIKIGGYNATSLFSEDHELFLRMLLDGNKMYNIQIPLYNYRVWTGASTGNNFDIQNDCMYRNGLSYLDKKFTGSLKTNFNYYFRRGLLEYYRGNMNVARHYLFVSLKMKPKKIVKLSRYLMISLLGNVFISWLRSIGLLGKVSILISKFFKRDFHIISPIGK